MHCFLFELIISYNLYVCGWVQSEQQMDLPHTSPHTSFIELNYFSSDISFGRNTLKHKIP